MFTLGLVGFFAWASLVPIPQGVPAVGRVVVDTKRKPVQHLHGGIVADVKVREGQKVKLGDPLLIFDSNAIRAEYESAKQQYFELKITRQRLLAELSDRSQVSYSDDLLAVASDDKNLRMQMENEQRLLVSRRLSLNSQLQSLKDTASTYRAMLLSGREIEANLNSQLSKLKVEIQGVKQLFAEGYFSKARVDEQESRILAVESQISENAAALIRSEQSLLALEQQGIALKADYKKELAQELAQLRPDLRAIEERYFSLERDFARLVVRSPANGSVVGLRVQTLGSVIRAGDLIMEIVPEDEDLRIEAEIAPQYIDRVSQGDVVDVRFNAFSNTPQLVVQGELESLSADVMTDTSSDKGQAPFYLARVRLSEYAEKQLGHRKLQPGMRVEVVIKTGSRTLLQYLMHPLTKRLAASLTEE